MDENTSLGMFLALVHISVKDDQRDLTIDDRATLLRMYIIWQTTKMFLGVNSFTVKCNLSRCRHRWENLDCSQ